MMAENFAILGRRLESKIQSTTLFPRHMVMKLSEIVTLRAASSFATVDIGA